MGPRMRLLVVAFAALAVFGPLALGASASGVRTGIYPEPTKSDMTPPTSPCVWVQTYASRNWGSFQTIRSEVDLIGCRNSAGELRVLSGPTCTATSFLGPGTATCVATRVGPNIRVLVHIDFPFGLSLIAGGGQPASFTVHPDGAYFSP